MSATLSTIVRPAIGKRPGVISRLFAAYCDGIARYFFRRSVIASLGELDDGALRDIGLVRSQIEAAIYGFITLSRPGEGLMMVPAAAMGQRAEGRRRPSTAEASPWS